MHEFGSDARLVKLLATQVGWGSGTPGDPYPAQFMLNTAMSSPLVNPDNYHADALAIAPYFAPEGMDSLPDTTTVDDVLKLSQQNIDSMTSAGGMVPGHKAVADAYGARLVCYEGGQSMVNSNSDTLTATFIAANRDPRIYGIYIDYLNKLEASGVESVQSFFGLRRMGQMGHVGLHGIPGRTHSGRAQIQGPSRLGKCGRVADADNYLYGHDHNDEHSHAYNNAVPVPDDDANARAGRHGKGPAFAVRCRPGMRQHAFYGTGIVHAPAHL